MTKFQHMMKNKTRKQGLLGGGPQPRGGVSRLKSNPPTRESARPLGK